jgi:hypothetical protein
MNILILGGGGREHALAWAVSQNPKCDRLIVAPGNAGIAGVAECAALPIADGDAVAAFCAENGIDFVIVGPEAPLAAGVADRLRAAGSWCSGPSAAAARLESVQGLRARNLRCRFDPRRGLGPVRYRRRGARPYPAARRPDRRQGRRACRGQGRDRGRDPCRGRGRACRAL